MWKGAGAVVEVARFDLVEGTGVGDIEKMFAGRKRAVEEGEADCMLMASKLVEVWWEHTRVCHRLAGGTRRMLQLISRETLQSVERD